MADLGRAARGHRLRDLPGFGEKLETNLRHEIERLVQRTHRLPLGMTLMAAEQVAGLPRRHPAVQPA